MVVSVKETVKSFCFGLYTLSNSQGRLWQLFQSEACHLSTDLEYL